MALTASNMLPLGTKAPNFNLPDQQGYHWSLADFSDDKALLVMFICNHCPYVVHLKSALAKFAREYSDKGLGIIAINANNADAYPADSPQNMALEIERYGYVFPYVYDETQEVAKSYDAACTPDFFLFDGDRKLVYRGQFDGSRPGNNVPVTGEDLRDAVNQILAGQSVIGEQTPSMGCNIKWRDD
ncbi:thioredoxin family protein [Hahella sp. CCB-MM4]|uniref:thioredoxin family protein n=1 Tax=Hahella sp. (strain CCB-MM4) TaxID=1926491 RepID=UPI000B9B70F1|nr:thioredoxin family protein [Hahella sp. CCB-MM4]OZG74616.1 thioredoxin family protein [Hahella sp. CCB-MM4]